MSPVEDHVPCTCEDPGTDWCPVHCNAEPSEPHDTDPHMPAVREVDAFDDDRFIVPQDLLHQWLSSPEPRIPWDSFVEMFRGTEDYPTQPDCPLALADTEPPSRP